MRTLILVVVYFLLITPIGALSRLIYDPLSRRWHPRAKTYWTPTSKSAPIKDKEA